MIAAEGIHFTDASGPANMRLYAIGDVHGRLDLLQEMHTRIRADLDGHPGKDWRIIHLGDYVDRGPDSRGVLEFLVQALDDPRNIALAGNHDIGFLDFLTEPDGGGLFANYGGRETALSYGVGIDFADPAGLRNGHASLLRSVPRRHQELLGQLRFSISFGDFFFCHAGIRPGVPLERQEPATLIWIRDAFLNWPGLHPKVVVHGHTPARQAEIRANRVNIDTQAFSSGRLTALVIDGRDKTLIEVSDRL